MWTRPVFAELRGPGEGANAQIKPWSLLRKLRCSPRKARHLVKAIAFLQNYEVARGRKGSLIRATLRDPGAIYQAWSKRREPCG